MVEYEIVRGHISEVEAEIRRRLNEDGRWELVGGPFSTGQKTPNAGPDDMTESTYDSEFAQAMIRRRE